MLPTTQNLTCLDWVLLILELCLRASNK